MWLLLLLLQWKTQTNTKQTRRRSASPDANTTPPERRNTWHFDYFYHLEHRPRTTKEFSLKLENWWLRAFEHRSGFLNTNPTQDRRPPTWAMQQYFTYLIPRHHWGGEPNSQGTTPLLQWKTNTKQRETNPTFIPAFLQEVKDKRKSQSRFFFLSCICFETQAERLAFQKIGEEQKIKQTTPLKYWNEQHH